MIRAMGTALLFLITGHPRRAYRQVRMWTTLRFSSEVGNLHLGCGSRRRENSINIDHRYTEAVDYVSDINSIPCREGSVSCVETYHVIEHMPLPKIREVLSKWYAIIKPGGMVIAECPDLDQAVIEYLGGNDERLFSIFGRQRFPGDAHFFGYNRKRLRKTFEDAGFIVCMCGEGTDYHAAAEPCLRIECRKPESISELPSNEVQLNGATSTKSIT